MSDDLARRGGQDRTRIDVNQDYDLRDGAKEFGVTQQQLKEAVQAVGSKGGRRTSRSAFAVRRTASVRVPLRSARPRSGRVADKPSLQSIERMKVGERPVCLTIRPGSSSASTSTGYRVLPSIGAGARIKTRRGTNATGWFADEAPRNKDGGWDLGAAHAAQLSILSPLFDGPSHSIGSRHESRIDRRHRPRRVAPACRTAPPGHAVTGIARNATRLDAKPNLALRDADATDAARLAPLLAGHDAVISASNFVSSNAQALIAAIKQAGVGRLLVVGGAGSLEVAPGKQLADTADFPGAYKPEANAGRAFLDILRKARMSSGSSCHRRSSSRPAREPASSGSATTACSLMRVARAGSPWRTSRWRWWTNSRPPDIRASASPSAISRLLASSERRCQRSPFSGVGDHDEVHAARRGRAVQRRNRVVVPASLSILSNARLELRRRTVRSA